MYKNNLGLIREKMGLTQKQMAKLIEMQITVYARYERGERDLPLSIAKSISEKTGASIDYIACNSKSENGIYQDQENEMINEMMNTLAGDEKSDTEKIKEFAKAIQEQINVATEQLNEINEYVKRKESSE